MFGWFTFHPEKITGLSSLQVSKVPSLRISESPIQTPPVSGREEMEVGMRADRASCSCWLSTVARVPPCCTQLVSASNQSREVEDNCQHLLLETWE